MRVVVSIDGREALPVRAIPFLTDWMQWYPDVLASVFAGTAGRGGSVRGSVSTFRLSEDRCVIPVPPHWWQNWIVTKLEAIDERLRATRGDTAWGYEEWRLESIDALPVGVFVWLDEFEAFHDRNWRQRVRLYAQFAGMFPAFIEMLKSLDWAPDQLQHSDEAVPAELLHMVKEDVEQLMLVRKLNLSPLILPAFRTMVMAGVPQAPAKSNYGRGKLAGHEDEITKRLAGGESQAALAKEFNVSRAAIANHKPKWTFGEGLGERKKK